MARHSKEFLQTVLEANERRLVYLRGELERNPDAWLLLDERIATLERSNSRLRTEIECYLEKPMRRKPARARVA